MTEPVPLTPLEPWIAAKIGSQGAGLSLEALRSYQLARLNETLSLVQRNSVFYKRRLGAGEISLGALDDLADLPFTAASQLRAAPLEFLCVSQSEVHRIVTLPTSGTTGAPKRIFFTGADQELTRDFFHWGMSTLVAPGDRVLILLPGELPGSVGYLLREGLARMDVEGIPHGLVTELGRTLEVMRAERATALVGIPIQVLQLARVASAGGRPRCAGLQSVLLSTDRVPRAAAKAIKETWGCDVYNHYGSTEMGLGGGVDCRARTGYHLREADLYFEIVDPISGRPAPEGESGEVVFTTLTRTAMPLVRYRTGDVSRFIPEPCSCGTVLRRMEHVDGRLDGGVELPGGGMLRQSDLDEALLTVEGLADFSTQFIRQGERASLVVRVRWLVGTARRKHSEVMGALRRVQALADEMAGERVTIDVLDWEDHVGAPPRAAKRRIEYSREAQT